MLFATHKSGLKLYYPKWDSKGEIVKSKKPTAAVTVTREGVTFPPGSKWIHRERSWGLQEGWKLANGSD